MVIHDGDNKLEQVKAFDDSKVGVKGLVDAGVTKLPSFFIHDPNNNKINDGKSCFGGYEIPLIDFQGINDDGRKKVIITEVKQACEKYGLFQVINHGIPLHVLDEMLQGIRDFHEQDVDAKKEYYSRDYKTKNFLYNSNFNLLEAKVAAWRDTFTFVRGSNPPNPDDLAPICRDIMIKYSNEVMKLGETIYKMLSEALGLDTNYLEQIGCNDGIVALGNYYPACPEPEMTIGSTPHVDSGFITILLQSHIPGLQILYQDQWIDVAPIHGALVVNLGNLMQLITNDMFPAAIHRVLASKEGPRTSMACIFRAHHSSNNVTRLYEPIKQLLAPTTPPLYRAVTIKDAISNKQLSKPNTIGNSLDAFRLSRDLTLK